MEKPTAVQQINDACKAIARELMRIHPAVPALGDQKIQEEVYKALFELTKNVETIKKRLVQSQSRDDAPEL